MHAHQTMMRIIGGGGRGSGPMILILLESSGGLPGAPGIWGLMIIRLS